jgi:hypothetical protein
MEQFREMKLTNGDPVSRPQPLPTPAPQTQPLVRLSEITLPSITQLNPKHYARQYVESRRIPEQYWDEIFFTEDYKDFLDTQFPGHGKDTLLEADPRLVLFYTNWGAEITNVSGRALTVADSRLRYITVKVSDQRKVYGLHRLDLDRRIYVTEGQFDAMFITNAVASGDSALNRLALWLYDTFGVRPVVVADNEPRNKQIVKMVRDSIVESGLDVCLLPENFPGKDINEAVQAGISQPELMKIIEANTYTGLAAQLKLSTWSKV